MDLRGKELKDSYDKLVTVGSGNNIEDGKGNVIHTLSIPTPIVVAQSIDLHYISTSHMPSFYLPQVSDLSVRLTLLDNYTTSQSIGYRITSNKVDQDTLYANGNYNRYDSYILTFSNVSPGYIQGFASQTIDVSFKCLVECYVG
jgi:hypothetical protein